MGCAWRADRSVKIADSAAIAFVLRHSNPHTSPARWATPTEPNCARRGDTAGRTPVAGSRARRAAVVLELRAGSAHPPTERWNPQEAPRAVTTLVQSPLVS